MGARRLWLGVLVSVCFSTCLLAVCTGVAWATNGSFQFGPIGTGAGQLLGPHGMAFDAQGDLYVGEEYNERVSRFAGSGSFQLAWGWKVNAEKPAEELQTCTAECRKGESGQGAGEFAGGSGATGVAVDNNSASSSYNDVYVVDWGHFRVEKFEPEEVKGKVVMKFVLMFGGHVNGGNGTDVCLAGEACTSGQQGTGDGEFSWAFEKAFIAVGPNGDVYIGDKARVQVFLPSGVWKENISLTSLTAEGKVTALAVNNAGDVYLKLQGVAGVREFEPGGIEIPTHLDEGGGERVESIALDKAGDVFISENQANYVEPCACDFLEYGRNGEELERFGGKTLITMSAAFAFDSTKQAVYVYGSDSNTEESGHYGVWSFPVPAPGPLIASGIATPELRGAASFAAGINPEGNTTTVHVEYVDEAHFKENGYATATSTAPVTLKETGFEEEHVEVRLPQKTLLPGTTYHWRVVAVDSLNHTTLGPDQSFQEIPAALVDGPWATNVAGTSATLSARIDPLGANTSYRLEYGISSSYEHVFNGNVGEGTGYVTIGFHHLQELQSDTTYHYRLITTSEVGTIETPDRTFRTQPAGASGLTLPDGRAWELVSPANKKAALIGPSSLNYWLTQAAGDGSKITYATNEPLGEGAVGQLFSSQALSMRVNGAWRTRYVAGREGLPPEGQSAKGFFASAEYWHVFSQDLSVGLLEPGSGPEYPQSSEANERTLYLRDSTSGSFLPLQDKADVPADLRNTQGFVGSGEGPWFYTATPNLSYVVFGTPRALTPEAESGEELWKTNKLYPWDAENLYEWHDGHLELVNVRPDGTTGVKGFANVGGQEERVQAGNMVARAISSDGRWIVWKEGFLIPAGEKDSLYARDMVAKRTVKLGGPFARFETMSSDGSKIFFVETERGLKGDLYVYDTETGTQTDLTANHGAGEPTAGVQNGLLGTSQDGSFVYFVATGVLANGAVSGADNLYLLHDGSGGWTTTFIAALSLEDEHTWGGREGDVSSPLRTPWEVDSEVSPNGRFAAFMSNGPLTSYDNRDAVSDQRDEEVYLYDSSTNKLVCASCNPTGARPVGLLDNGGTYGTGYEGLLVDTTDSWSGRHAHSDHWLAGSLVGWNNMLNLASYQPRYAMDNGRLFFNSPDALAPQDTNGLEDVYEYEPPGVGSCTTGAVSYSAASGGCVNLISGGQAATESAFMDASETGDDVFFVTAQKLVAEDYDNAYDMYDAHACTSELPCRSEPVSSPECTSGDSCKAAPSPQPVIFGAAPSATFNGTGNVLPAPAGSVVPRALTRAQKLARALSACHEKRAKRKRVACERDARRRFSAEQSRKAKATKRGNK